MVNNTPLNNLPYPLIKSVGIVVFQNNSVLIVKHETASHHFKGVLGLPAGKIDQGETAIQTAVRELKEETGLVTTISDMIPLPHAYRATITQKDGTKIFDWYVFLCKKYTGNLTATTETIPAWVNRNNLDTLELLPNVKNAIEEATKLL